MTPVEYRAALEAIRPLAQTASDALAAYCTEAQKHGLSGLDVTAAVIAKLWNLRLVLAVELGGRWSVSFRADMTADEFESLASTLLDERDTRRAPTEAT